MKKRLQALAVILLLCSAGLTATAQDETAAPVHRNTPRWVSSKGYWIVESNVREPLHACIYFYNNDNKLVHRETVDGKSLSVNKTRTKMKLKKALDIVVDAWATGHPYDSSQTAVAALFTK
jgi:hypothetical protein